MTFDQYWKSVESKLGPTNNTSLRLALYECAKQTWADASAAVLKVAEEADARWSTHNLAARIKEMPAVLRPARSMKTCKCGSYAINPGFHGRGQEDLDLCDVCYWRKRAERALEFEAPLLFKLAYHADHAMEMEANLGPTPEFILRAAVVDRTEIVHPFEEI